VTRLRDNILALFTLQGANYLLPLITVPYLVRVLGPDYFGRVSFAQAFVQYFVLLTDYGFTLSATRAVSGMRNDPGRLSRFFTAVMVLKLVLMVSGFALMIAVVGLVPVFGQDWSLYVLSYLAVAGNVFFPVWLFQGLERMKYITILTLLGRIVTTAAIFALVHQRDDYRLAAALQASGFVVAGLCSMAVMPRVADIRLRWPGVVELRSAFADGWHIFVTTAAISLYTNSDVFVLGLLTNPASVGYFSAASKLVGAVQALINPVSQAVFPYIVALAQRSRDAAISFAGRLLRVQGLATLGMSALLFVLAKPLAGLLFGAQFTLTATLVEWMAAVPFVVGLSNVLGIQVMFVFGMDRLVARIALGCGIVNLLLVVALVRAFGATGAAMSLLFVESLVTVFEGVAVARAGLMRGIASSAFGRAWTA
jgi:PST family polysaccharide transporter